MKSLPNIQELIDIKAENRLRKDLADMRKSISNIPVLMSTDTEFPSISIEDDKTKPYWFFNDGGAYYKALFTYWLPIYKNQEAQMFLNKVEELQAHVNDLINTTEHLQQNDY